MLEDYRYDKPTITTAQYILIGEEKRRWERRSRESYLQIRGHG